MFKQLLRKLSLRASSVADSGRADCNCPTRRWGLLCWRDRKWSPWRREKSLGSELCRAHDTAVAAAGTPCPLPPPSCVPCPRQVRFPGLCTVNSVRRSPAPRPLQDPPRLTHRPANSLPWRDHSLSTPEINGLPCGCLTRP